MEITPQHDVTREQRRLLGGWRDVADDVQRLATALKGVSDGCACGDGLAHLKGSCSCRHSEEGHHAGCIDCEVLLHAVSWRADAAIEDTSRFLPAVSELLSRLGPEDGKERVRDIQHEIAKVAHAMTGVEAAAEEFARGCGLDHLQDLRRKASGLLENVRALSDLLIPRQAGPTRYNGV